MIRGASQVEKGSADNQYMVSTTRGNQADGVAQGVEQPNDYIPLRPPTKDEIKRELLRKRYDASRYEAEYIKNRRAAIKEILQENVKQNTGVLNPILVKKFNEGVRGG